MKHLRRELYDAGRTLLDMLGTTGWWRRGASEPPEYYEQIVCPFFKNAVGVGFCVYL